MKKLFILSLVLLLANSMTAETKQGVLYKLHNTIIKKFDGLDGLIMPEVLEVLSEASGEKVNFMYMPHLGKSKTVPNSVTNTFALPNFPSIDPTTGLPNIMLGQQPVRPPARLPYLLPLAVDPPVEVMPKIRGVRVKLRNVTLKQLLDITTLSFDKPVKYVVTSYGVIFLPREENKPLLFNRVYQINPRLLNK